MDERLTTILSEAEITVAAIFEKRVKPSFFFHNLEHTKQVVAAAREIAAYYQIGETEAFVVCVAAWFHDTGYSAGKVEGHEKESAAIATIFLRAHHIVHETIQQVTDIILATQMPQSPQNLAGEILCDADLYHLGTVHFFEMNDSLRREVNNYFNLSFTRHEWRIRNLLFLSGHTYFTGYCQQKLEPVKEKWIRLLQHEY